MNDGDCCIKSWIGNCICDVVNNFSSCGNYDGGDCRPRNITKWPECPHNPEFIGDKTCDDHLKTNPECNNDGGDCCDQTLIGNRKCDEPNNFISCGHFDGGDCHSDGQHCDESQIGNGQCEQINIHANCNFDGGDCCTDVLIGNRFCDDFNNFPI